MSNINSEEILITFKELCQLDKDDISVCVNKYSALNICEKSSAPPVEIYNIWVQKLLRAYDLQEFTHKDWHRILDYLTKILKEFVESLKVSNENVCGYVEKWWQDTQDMLNWLETIVNNLDIPIVCLILTFAMEVVVKTCKFANKINFKTLCGIQQMVVNITDNFIYKKPIKESNEFESFNKILSSLCDVGCMIFSGDIKTSIETWRIVAKLGDKLHSLRNNFPVSQKATETLDGKQWYEKAILGIFKELHEILNYYQKNPDTCNDNLLQVCQFYLKILRIIIDNSRDELKIFPATQQFMDIYSMVYHDLADTQSSKVDLYINKGLYEILEIIHKDNNVSKEILHHLKNDVDNFKSCNIILDYLKVNVEYYCKNRLNSTIDVNEMMHLFDIMFKGPLIFIDKRIYPRIVSYFAVLTALDISNELHKKLCKCVLDTQWIKSYASMEILRMYYSNILQQPDMDMSFKCLEFWLEAWNKLNKANESYGQQKKLIEVLLKTILNSISDTKLLQYCNSNKYDNFEILLLLCGKENKQIVQYFQTNLNKHLRSLQERQMRKRSYRELLNLLDICNIKPQLINYQLKEHLFATFTSLFSLYTKEFLKFKQFLDKSLIYFNWQQDKLFSDKLLKHLVKHEPYCAIIQSVALIEFLIKLKPQSMKLLQTLKTSDQQNSTIIMLLDTSLYPNKETLQRSLNHKIFQDLNKTYQQSSYPDNGLEQIRKKPRLDQGNFSNIKLILNDLKRNTQQLMNFNRSAYDANDCELLLVIKENIEKCLTK